MDWGQHVLIEQRIWQWVESDGSRGKTVRKEARHQISLVGDRLVLTPPQGDRRPPK